MSRTVFFIPGTGMAPAQTQNGGEGQQGEAGCPGSSTEGLLTEVTVQGEGPG